MYQSSFGQYPGCARPDQTLQPDRGNPKRGTIGMSKKGSGKVGLCIGTQVIRLQKDFADIPNIPVEIDLIITTPVQIIKGKAREQALSALREGTAQLAVGTHALFQDDVEFQDLALVIIDEQHRFGVHQRLALREKGRRGRYSPHQLIMTATPIPRTLAMSAYADLDTSVIDELPPGRTPVTTVAVSATRRKEVIDRIRQACAAGRQAYWVCTLIEESDVLQAQAAEDATAMARWVRSLGMAAIVLDLGTRPQPALASLAATMDGSLPKVSTTVLAKRTFMMLSPGVVVMVVDQLKLLATQQINNFAGLCMG